ncbi:Ger(x)C family spore germination protein [Lutispora saccharofermentans]|uniref:Ger(X)C family spore germination protein n=1 Tax=Lutispora saccharofermentans TaxID=3024236 RepID=A0ABT1NGS5_9FIRM|nr:Ger(x)C family spore germination protein [Lutispora saccharofermentans]MCQ1530487.1 Ger(x)C family spore germination protein [Lutispora saccharofermentans]
MEKELKIIVFVCILAIIITGCTDKREINETSIVSATAIDYDSESDEFVVSVSTITPAGSPSNKNGQNEKMIWTATERGKTILDATRNLRLRSALSLSWIHCKIYIIGKDAASYVLHEIADTMARSREVKYSSYVLLTEGRVQDILTIKPEMSRDISTEILGMITATKEHGRSYTLNIKDFLANLSGEYKDSILGRINLRILPYPPQPTEQTRDILEGKSTVVMLEGAAVIRDGKLSGWLNKDETRAFLLIKGKLKEGLIPVIYRDNTVSVIIRNIKTQIDPVLSGNKPVFNINISYNGQIDELGLRENANQHTEVSIIKALLEEKTKEDVLGTIKKVQTEYEADIFDFNGEVYRKHPHIWKSLKDKWRDIYKDAEFKVSVNVEINKTGFITKPIMRENE